MCAGLQEKQNQLCVVLLPCHQPIWLNVALPLPLQIARQFVWTVLSRQRSCGCKQLHCFKYELHVIATFLTQLQFLIKAFGGLYPVCHRAMPSF